MSLIDFVIIFVYLCITVALGLAFRGRQEDAEGYFTADGKFKRIDQNNNPDSGKWDFDPDGSLCLERRKRKCWYLQAAEEGVYHVISRRRGQHAKTWRIEKGNPYNL